MVVGLKPLSEVGALMGLEVDLSSVFYYLLCISSIFYHRDHKY